MFRRYTFIIALPALALSLTLGGERYRSPLARADNTPATLASNGSLTTGGAMDPVITPPSQAQLDAHQARLAYGAAHAGPSGGVSPMNEPGNYDGDQRTIGVYPYAEPNEYAYRNYCAPASSIVLLSNWIGINNVPGIDTIAADEDTDPNSGTLFKNVPGAREQHRQYRRVLRERSGQRPGNLQQLAGHGHL